MAMSIPLSSCQNLRQTEVQGQSMVSTAIDAGGITRVSNSIRPVSCKVFVDEVKTVRLKMKRKSAYR